MKKKQQKRQLIELALLEINGIKRYAKKKHLINLDLAQHINVFNPSECIYGVMMAKESNSKKVIRFKKKITKKWYNRVTDLSSITKDVNYSPLEVLICWLKPKHVKQIVAYILGEIEQLSFKPKQLHYFYEPGNSTINLK